MRSLSLLAIGCVLVATACGGDANGGTGPDPEPDPNGGAVVRTVTMGAASFSPSAVTISVNQVVRWANSSGLLHNVRFSSPNAPADIADHSGGTNDRTFTVAGNFPYVCTLHVGMTGTVTVQ